MDGRTKKLEKLKNAVIVVLFLTTILLLNLTWRSEGSGSFRLPNVLDLISPDVWVPDAEEFMVPERSIYGFGDGTFSVSSWNAPDDLETVLSLIRKESGSASFLINEVTPEQYREMFTGYRTLKVSFSYLIPFGEFCDRCGINRSSSFDQVGSFDSFLLSEAAPESFFVEGGGKCWRFISDSEEDVATPVLSTMIRLDPVCYTAGSMFGNENLSLLPLTDSNVLADSSWRSEAASDVEKAGREMAESVFGENFDFVRRITDSFGNVTYMYGYGEKTLTCLKEGIFEYKTETAEGPDPGFYQSLQTAIAFTATHGGWGSDRRKLAYVLQSAKETGSGRNKSYTFEFAQVEGGVLLFAEDGPAITVRVSGSEVDYYRRAVVEANVQTAELRQTADAANVIAGNSHLIHSVLGGNLLAASSDLEFSFVAQKYREASAGYIVSEEALKPVWVITMEGGTKFFFGLYDALPLGFTRK